MPWNNPSLTKDGRVKVNPTSLVAVVDIRPVTLGERIRRYMRTPQFLQDMNRSDGYDEDDLLIDPHEPPMSPYEDRAVELAERVKKRKAEEREAEKQRLIDQEKAEKDAFRKRYNEIRREADEPPLPFDAPQ